MRVLVTGAKGFIGKNLCLFLKQSGFDVCEYDLDYEGTLQDAVQGCGFVMHLAGVNRPKNEEEFAAGNAGVTEELVRVLKEDGRKLPLLVSSSVQAERDNPYGRSKKAAEDLVFAYGRDAGAPVYVYRLDNAFGKWCRPDYNSVVATFCRNIAEGREIVIHDPAAEVTFVYIDDICRSFLSCINTDGSDEILKVQPSFRVTVGRLAELLYGFRKSRETRTLPCLAEDSFEKRLYSTYLSYLPEDAFLYDLDMHTDARGSFTEFIRTPERGQVSVNVSNPGIVKGNHWHHTKNEKFLVVRGTGVIRFRRIGDDRVFEYPVSGEKLQVVDIPVGYTHNIENTGDDIMVTIMWANEPFDPDHPDTFFEEV